MDDQYDASYDDANRPTCKVVKRDGQKGARIFPKGCKVRSLARGAGQGELTERFTTEGKRKMTFSTARDKYYVMLSRSIPLDALPISGYGAPGDEQFDDISPDFFQYDTGAQIVLVGTEAAADRLVPASPRQVSVEPIAAVRHYYLSLLYSPLIGGRRSCIDCRTA